jgi:DNA-binding PadR family transcriptional regulator
MTDTPGNVPLSPAAFHILVAVAGEPKHGYGIMKEVAATTSGQVKLHAGTLYTTIKRLLDDGWIRETVAPMGAGSEDERRRYYSITPEGRQAAEAELVRLRSLVDRAAGSLHPEPSA